MKACRAPVITAESTSTIHRQVNVNELRVNISCGCSTWLISSGCENWMQKSSGFLFFFRIQNKLFFYNILHIFYFFQSNPDINLLGDLLKLPDEISTHLSCAFSFLPHFFHHYFSLINTRQIPDKYQTISFKFRDLPYDFA